MLNGMEYLVTCGEMRRYDQNTSGHFGIPPAVLMERAALACAQLILDRQEALVRAMAPHGARPGKKVLVAAGSGNNGGDGFAIGRLLMQAGFDVDFFLAGEEERVSPLTASQIASVRAYGGVVMRNTAKTEYDIIIDALFGVGLSRPLSGIYREAVDSINGQNAYVLSVDIPSGIHSDTGEVMGAAVKADVTVTFGFQKRGTFLYPGKDHAGTVIVREIGITQDSFLGEPPKLFTFTGPVASLMPKRAAGGNKGTFGKLLLLAGSSGMAGACLLSGGGAFAAGAGMLKIMTPECNRSIVQQKLPEAMLCDYQAAEDAVSWADVIAAGPGLSTSAEAKNVLHYILTRTDRPLVLDADAINILAGDRELIEALADLQNTDASWRALILTPHPGELARLAGCPTQEVSANPAAVCGEWAEKLRATVLCKGARTFAAAADGRLYVNGSGNSGMATAGSGDVLTGIVAALCATEPDSFLAACKGVYLHGLAGDMAARIKSEYSMKAGDIVEMVPRLLLLNERKEEVLK